MIIDPTFPERATFKSHKKPDYMGMDWYKHEKMHCKKEDSHGNKCNYDWGVRAQVERHFELPILKKEGVMYKDLRNNKIDAKPVSRWEQLEIKFEENTTEEIVNSRAQQRQPDSQ